MLPDYLYLAEQTFLIGYTNSFVLANADLFYQVQLTAERITYFTSQTSPIKSLLAEYDSKFSTLH